MTRTCGCCTGAVLFCTTILGSVEGLYPPPPRLGSGPDQDQPPWAAGIHFESTSGFPAQDVGNTELALEKMHLHPQRHTLLSGLHSSEPGTGGLQTQLSHRPSPPPLLSSRWPKMFAQLN